MNLQKSHFCFSLKAMKCSQYEMKWIIIYDRNLVNLFSGVWMFMYIMMSSIKGDNCEIN